MPAAGRRLNCALGAAEELRALCGGTVRGSPSACQRAPNAGLPNEFGEYDETRRIMAAEVRDFAARGFLNMVGGCCGTTPEHIRAIAEAVAGVAPRPLPRRRARPAPVRPRAVQHHASRQLFVNVGERTNVTGSARFKR
jgi:5-methyltetrahydrofolate--homocysteine methyltransferase